jgi:hypothetical protein
MSHPVEEPRRAEIVVAVEGAADPGEIVRTAHRIGRQIGETYHDRRAVVLLLGDRAPGASDPQAATARVPLLPWSHPGQSAIEATLRAAEAFDATACALVPADSDDRPTEGARDLLAPILGEGLDFASPHYASERFDGVLSTGLVYPTMRALFGKRLRQPLAPGLALSRRSVAHLLGEAWHADPAHAGDRMWLVTGLLSHELEPCQAHCAERPRRAPENPADLSASLANVVGLLFHEMRVHAPQWQRVKGSRPLRSFGEPVLPPGDARHPQIAPMLSAFKLGYQELGRLWGAVLPPQTLLALKRLTGVPEESFAVEDSLWARIVYDFAVAYHLALMDRALLLRSMTPLYLAWAAGFVREARDLDAAEVEPRVERLCRSFEALKPYLISRWRWPDRFNP